MSDSKKNANLGDFFKAQNKKKKTTKKVVTTENESSIKQKVKESEPNVEEQKHANKQEDFADSSDEEKTDIILDEAAAIKDKKDIEATKKAQAEKDDKDKFGWGGLGSKV